MAPVTREDVEKLISTIRTLSQSLPTDTVQLGTREDFLYKTFVHVKGENDWHTFNRRFDLVFGEDCRDSHGRLEHMRRGQYGLDFVVEYLETTKTANGMMFELMKLKLDRLIAELKHLVYVPLQLTLLFTV